ncbi:MAG: hypothetical protein ACRDKH_05515 [Solirubrobacterales bacterium]
MDFLALCQALGLAIAAGVIIGAATPAVMPSWGVMAGAAPLGILVAAASLDADDEDVWISIPLGALAAAFAAVVAADVTVGATRRALRSGEIDDTQPPAGVVAYAVLAAVLLALGSLVVPPLSLLALAALIWLWASRRRRAQQKHEGLRVLR